MKERLRLSIKKGSVFFNILFKGMIFFPKKKKGEEKTSLFSLLKRARADGRSPPLTRICRRFFSIRFFLADVFFLFLRSAMVYRVFWRLENAAEHFLPTKVGASTRTRRRRRRRSPSSTRRSTSTRAASSCAASTRRATCSRTAAARSSTRRRWRR